MGYGPTLTAVSLPAPRRSGESRAPRPRAPSPTAAEPVGAGDELSTALLRQLAEGSADVADLPA
jgi:sugar/nucleoside kinase (ribokinase family)